MGVRVDYVDGLAEAGLYIHDERRVEVRNGLHPDIERSVLAHEAVHAELRHEPQDRWCHELQQERLASALAGRRLIDFWRFMSLKAAGCGEREMSEELCVARSVLRAYIWLAAPAWHPAAA
jgi:hypothetical protein